MAMFMVKVVGISKIAVDVRRRGGKGSRWYGRWRWWDVFRGAGGA